ncbi:MAG: hypothetical protein U0838_17495 [Chloroflexota bacterium]
MPFLWLILALVVVNGAVAVAYVANRAGGFVKTRRGSARLSRERLIDGIRLRGLRPYFSYMRAQYLTRVNPLHRKLGRRQGDRKALEALRNDVRAQIWRDGDWSVGFVIVVALLAGAWGVLFLIQRNLDVRMLLSLGYAEIDPGLAALLGTAIALAITVLGVVIFGLLKLHPLLPSWLQIRRKVRLLVAANLGVVALAVCLALPTIAPFRSHDALGAEVTQLRGTLEGLSNTGGDATEIAVTRLQLERAERRLEAGQGLDRGLAAGVPLLELLISPVVVYAGELLFLLALGGGIRVVKRQEAKLQDGIAEINDEFATEMATVTYAAGRDPDELDRLMNAPERLPPGDADDEAAPPAPDDVIDADVPEDDDSPPRAGQTGDPWALA